MKPYIFSSLTITVVFILGMVFIGGIDIVLATLLLTLSVLIHILIVVVEISDKP